MKAAPKDGNGRLSGLYENHGEKLRFLVVGAANTAIAYVLFIVMLAALQVPFAPLAASTSVVVAFLGRNYYLVAQWTTWVVGVLLSTFTMKHFAFRSSGRYWPQARRAYLVYLPAQGLSSLILWATVTLAHLSPPVGQLVAIGVTTLFSYYGHKFFTFREVNETPRQA